MSPTVSVVMSVHNGLPYVSDAVRSILAQNYPDYEFLILDDASTDGTGDYLKALSDPRVRVISLAQNIGLTAALNHGIAEARGEFIARQDVDDWSHPDRFRCQVGWLKTNPNCGVVGSQVHLVDGHGRSLGKKRLPLEPDSIRFAHLFDNALAHSATMFRTSVVRAVGGYNETFPVSQDYELWSRISDRNSLMNLPQFLVTLRVLDTSITRQHKCPELIRRIQQEHFFRLFARQPTAQELELVGLFRTTLAPDRLDAFRELLSQLLTLHSPAVHGCTGDFRRMISLIHERIGYNLLTVSRSAAWRELASAIRTWPPSLLSLPWMRIFALTLLGNSARTLYTKAVK